MRAGVTLNGMLKYDPTLFDGVTVPAGVDRGTLVDTICFSYGDLYLSNTDPAWTKEAITVWGARHQYYMDELYKTLSYEYNPIENYDRYEEYTDTSTSTTQMTSNGSTNTNVAAYDAATLQPDTSGTDTNSTNGSNSGSVSHNAHIHGNIGVTTAAQMIQGQRDIIKISWYDEIAKLFASEFLLMLY